MFSDYLIENIIFVSKTVIITEEQASKLFKSLLSEETIRLSLNSENAYPIDPEQVLIVKKFLDDTFQKVQGEMIGADGYKSNVQFVRMVDSNGEKLKDMYLDDLKDLLIDKYQGMFSNPDQREKFLGQVMKDWYDNKIGLYGSLSVNHL